MIHDVLRPAEEVALRLDQLGRGCTSAGMECCGCVAAVTAGAATWCGALDGGLNAAAGVVAAAAATVTRGRRSVVGGVAWLPSPSRMRASAWLGAGHEGH